ncbi:MAG: PAS domain S-box protein [Bacteroidetes bacterium]|nr:MAG: PAS domain S-box protein [Bacteroidota bacterium]
MTPEHHFENTKDQYRARLLSSLMLIVGPIGLLVAMAPDLFGSTENVWEDPEVRLMLFIMPIIIGIYWMGRTHYYKWLSYATVIGAAAAIFVASVPDDNAADLWATSFLVVPILLSSIFLSFRVTIGVIIANLIGVFVFYQYGLKLSFGDVTVNALAFLIVNSVIILLSTYFRDLMELENQTTLTLSESRYRGLLEAAFEGVLIVENGLITEANAGIERILGYSPAQIAGRPVQDLLEAAFISGGEGVVDSSPVESVARAADGAAVPVELVVREQAFWERRLQVVAVRDISERKRVEAQIEQSLHEKEVLLKEIHHRVKNNLQVITSLINLQMEQIDDEEMRDVFRESQNRIRTMALIHEKLYQSQDLARIDFGEYAQNLVNMLLRSYRSQGAGVEVVYLMDGVWLPVDTAVPCGLILNELVSNCLKHAFVDGRRGCVTIQLHALPNGDYQLAVADNGVGIAPDYEQKMTASLGMMLVQTLAAQLAGTLSISGEDGTNITITFPGKKE